MSDNLLEYAKDLGGSLRRTVDMETGEVIFMGQDGAPCSRADAVGSLSGATARTEGASLSTCHNSPKVEYYAGASLLTVKRISVEKKEEKEEEEKPKEERAKRGKAGFSWRSRIRMQRTIAKVLDVAVPVFITLTFPSQYPTIETAKRDLDVFIKRLARKFPNVSGIWKLEPQKRGAPHFHLLVWGADIAELMEFVPGAWFEIVGSGDPNHLAWHKGELGNEHCVMAVESLAHARAYASKYMSKEVGITFSDWGRWWGVFFRGRLPNGEKIQKGVSDKKAIEIIRYMRKFLEHVTKKKIRRDFGSLTIICNADFWMNRLL